MARYFQQPAEALRCPSRQRGSCTVLGTLRQTATGLLLATLSTSTLVLSPSAVVETFSNLWDCSQGCN